MTPRYRHDCDNCVFLGPYAANGLVYDLYYHPGGVAETLVARCGDDGSDYESGPPSISHYSKILTVAQKIATKKGLL